MQHVQVRAIFRGAKPRLWGAYAQRCGDVAEDLDIGVSAMPPPCILAVNSVQEQPLLFLKPPVWHL